VEEKRRKCLSILMVEVVRVFVYLSAVPDDALAVSVDVSLCFLFVQFDAIFSVNGIFDYCELQSPNTPPRPNMA
jgi:hypothetical protein